jgi:hypothetical protein
MINVSSKSYKVLKKLSKLDNSSQLKGKDSMHTGPLQKYGFTESVPLKIEDHHTLMVEKITTYGKEYIHDHRKATIEKWLFWGAPFIIAVVALIISILK